MKLISIIAYLILIIGTCFAADVYRAVCTLETTRRAPNEIKGNVYFEQNGDVKTIRGTISGLTEGEHGLHIHYFGDISNNEGARVGNHFNIDNNNTHGKPPSTDRHVGDMGSITADSSGSSTFELTGHLWTLDGSTNTSIIGRSLVIHEKGDDGTDPQGQAGYYIAQCTIGIRHVESQDRNLATFGNLLSPKFASCEMHGTTDYDNIVGRVTFLKTLDGIEVRSRVCNLPNGKHGFHIHEFGDHSDAQGSQLLGEHWNPRNGEHGLPGGANRHDGDLGNIETTGVVGESVMTDKIIKLEGIQSVLGRSVVIHILEDTGEAGSYGPKVASCVVGLTQEQYSLDDACTNQTYEEDLARKIVFYVALGPVIIVFLLAMVVLCLL